MATVVEQRPQPRRGLGCCLGKGCLIIVIFFLMLAVVFVVGGFIGTRSEFTSTKPRDFPVVPTSPEQQQAVLQRWDNFEKVVENPQPTPVAQATPGEPAPTAAPTPAHPTIEFTANDINQLISANRKARGKAFVSIAGGIGHVGVSIPLNKLGFSHRYFNANFEVRAAPDGNPGGIQITTESSSGMQVPGRVLNFLLGMSTVHSYIDPYVNEYRDSYHVSSFQIKGDRVVIEASPPH